MKLNINLTYLNIYIIHVVIILLYVIFSILFVLNQDLFKGYSMDGFRNDFCQKNSTDIICNNKYKKDKLFYILIDGLAYDQLYELRKKDKYNITRIFRGVTSDYKQSAVNFEIIFGGKVNRNFIGKRIKEDNIFLNMVKLGKKFSFRGIQLVVYSLAGNFFDKYKITPTEIDSMDTMCDSWIKMDGWTKKFLNDISDDYGNFKKGYNKEYLYQELDKHFSKELEILNERGENDFITKCLVKNYKYTGEESILYYGNKIDHINHNFFKENINVIFQMYITEKLIIRCINWCWDHPDYAFFFVSDHGGQKFYGEDNIINHGNNTVGNEAAFFAWSRELSENYEKLKLDDKIVSLFDLSTLVPQLMKGGSIPLESLGTPSPLANDTIFSISSIKAKSQQLLKYMEIFTNKYPKNVKILEKYKNMVSEIYNSEDKVLIDNTNNILKNLSLLQTEISDVISENNKNIFFLIAFYSIFLILGLVLAYDIYTLKNIIEQDNILIFIVSLIFGVFFMTIFMIIYPSKHVYEQLYNSTINQYYAFSFLIIIYILLNFKNMEKNDLLYYSLLSFVLLMISVLSTLFYKYEVFLKMKRLFTSITLAKSCDYAIFYPLFAFYMYREIRNLKNKFYDSSHNYSAFKIASANAIVMFIFMVIFEIIIPVNFEIHSIFSLITNYFVLLFLLFFFVSSFFKFYSENTDNQKFSYNFIQTGHVNGFQLLKLFLMIYQFYLSDEAERTILLFMFIPFLEFLSSKFFGKTKIEKLLILICFMGYGEIFYLITQRFYSFDISIKVASRTIGMTAEDLQIFTGILFGTHKLRYLLLCQGYLMGLSRFYKEDDFFTNTSFMIRLILFVQMIGKIIYFYYRYFNNLIGEEFLELFMWTMLHLIMFAIDVVCIIFYYISERIYNKRGNFMKLENEINDIKIELKLL